jgi:UTP--glucose-1-phosphate uridylyltransferase
MKKKIFLIIPAAGLGTRMRQVTPDLPKELLPVGHKPAIQYTVEEGFSASIKNIVIIISRQKEIIRQYFEDNTISKNMFPHAFKELEKIKKGCTFTFLYQKEPLGESDAINYAKDIVGCNSVAIIYPDNLYFPAPGALKILKSAFIKHKKDIVALSKVTDELSRTISNAGRVDIKPLDDSLFNIEKFIPKSPGHFIPRFKGECGIYISGPHIFKYIERMKSIIKESELTDTPVRSLILKEKGFWGCRLPGTVFDIGNPEGYELCLEYIRRKIKIDD